MATPADDARATVLHNLGVTHSRGIAVLQDWAKAAHYFQLAAERGHADAQHSLGYCFETGRGVAQDLVEAARYSSTGSRPSRPMPARRATSATATSTARAWRRTWSRGCAT
jgi:hypothetical protein